jgi:bacteriocin resistance YdeI/OmpD-like protein/uncharacterized protein DUF1905
VARHTSHVQNQPFDGQHVFCAHIYKIGIIRCVDVPRSVSGQWKGRTHVPVHGWIEGIAMRGTLVRRGRGAFRLHVHSRIWRKLGVDAGAAIEVALGFDAESREPIVPEDLAAALADAPPALQAFRTLTTNLRAALVRWVAAAKRDSTRKKRRALCVRRMHERAARAGKSRLADKSARERRPKLK